MVQGFDYRVVDIKRVTRVTEGGKRMKVRAVVVVGNYEGKVGIGVAKGQDIADAVLKARRKAEKEVFDVPIIDEKIPYEIKVKFGATKVLLKPAKTGRGLVAGGPVRTVLSLCGYKDVVSKILGVTKNNLVNVFATLKALKNLSKSYDIKLKLKEKNIKSNANPSTAGN